MEKSSEGVLFDVLFRTLCSMAFCALFGFLRWNIAVFDTHQTAFEYIAFPAIAGLYFHTLRTGGTRIGLIALLGSSLTISVLALHSHGLGTLRDALLTLSIGLVFYFYHTQIHSRRPRRRVLEPLLTGLGMEFGGLGALVLIVVLSEAGDRITVAWGTEILEQWFVIGFGIGAGIVLTEPPFTDMVRRWWSGIYPFTSIK